MRTLGVDPGISVTGYGIVEDREKEIRMIDYGVLVPPNYTSIADQLQFLYAGLMELLLRYQPDEVAIEEVFVAKNSRSTLAMGRAQAVAILAAANHRVPVYTYTPTQIKQVVASYGGSGKEQVQKMVQIQLGLPQIPQPSDAADALAVAICHLRQKEFAKALGREDDRCY